MKKVVLVFLLLTMLIGGCSLDNRGKANHFEFVKTEALIAPPESMSDKNFTAGAYYPTLVKMEGIDNFPYRICPLFFHRSCQR